MSSVDELQAKIDKLEYLLEEPGLPPGEKPGIRGQIAGLLANQAELRAELRMAATTSTQGESSRSVLVFKEIDGEYVERHLDFTEQTLQEDFKRNIFYFPHKPEAFDDPQSVKHLADFEDDTRYLQMGYTDGFVENYVAATEMEAGLAAKHMLSLSGLDTLHHHTGCKVFQGKTTRMDTDALLFHCGPREGSMIPELDDVLCDTSAIMLLKSTILNLEVKSAITGRDDRRADLRVEKVIDQIAKHHRAWREMKAAPDKFKMTTRFGQEIPITHFTHAKYMIWGVASPLFNPYARDRFLALCDPILPFELSGTRFVPTFSQQPRPIVNGQTALSLFRQLKPFIRAF